MVGLAEIKKFVLLSNFGNKPEAGYLIMYRFRSPQAKISTATNYADRIGQEPEQQQKDEIKQYMD